MRRYARTGSEDGASAQQTIRSSWRRFETRARQAIVFLIRSLVLRWDPRRGDAALLVQAQAAVLLRAVSHSGYAQGDALVVVATHGLLWTAL